MYRRILVATGGSPWSDAATTYAVALAAHLQSELCLLTVLNASGVYAMPEVMSASELLMESVEQQGQEILAQAVEQAVEAAVPHSAVLKWGNIAETILQTAAEETCDLIVLGSRGLSGFKRLMLGSISNAVAAKAQCPVLLIKQPPTPSALPWHRALLATGGSPWSDAAVEHALQLAQGQHMEVCVLYVDNRRVRRGETDMSLTSDGKNILALAEARAAAAGVPHHTAFARGDVATLVVDMAARQQCDLIVLGSRGLTGFKRLMLGSISNAVAATAPLPVLIVKRFLL
ncbi:MAG: universal stress protein [Candidatus Tectimicrobiota bacterium]